ncbi:MAG TPA: type II secretion system minor pseudopilin GspI [Solimonas sp.]
MTRTFARGFTLIEMLAAVAVLAMAMAAILAGMSRYADNAGHLRDRTIAIWVAHNRLTQIELDRTWPDIGKSDGDMEMAGLEWRWEVEVQKTPDENLRRIDIWVLPQNGKRNDAPTLTAFFGNSGRQ